MWVCKRCGSTFSNPDLMIDHAEQYGVCPTCFSKNIKEARICYVCGSPTDNYGLCDTCRAEVKKDFAAWLNDEVRSQHIRVDDAADCVCQYLDYL